MRKVKKNISVIILAGGNAQRLNFPKPYLLFNARITFLEKLIGEYYKFGCKKIIVTLNKNYFIEDLTSKIIKTYDALFVINAHPESGKSYSLKLGIAHLTNEHYCFIQNIDNPFTNLFLLNSLNDFKTSAGYTVPVLKQKGGHPILIGRTVIKDIKKSNDKDFNLRIFLNKYQRNEVLTKNKKILANINTLTDYQKYFYYQVKRRLVPQ